MSPTSQRNLPRLARGYYKGHVVVFWTNTLEKRARGWLTSDFHFTFRELLLHAAARENLFCPAYCLMPDHLHLIWMGMRLASDQRNAMKFLRVHLEPALGDGRVWQHQAHDHVLREKERNAMPSSDFVPIPSPIQSELGWWRKKAIGLISELSFQDTRPFTRSRKDTGIFFGNFIQPPVRKKYSRRRDV